jgi:hypothetical protein
VPLPGWLRTPRAAAAAVLAMLGFGVVVGSTVAPGIASVVPRALVVVLGGSVRPASAVASAGGGGGGGGGGAGTTTITTSTPATAPQQTNAATTTTTAPSGYRGLPPIKHVFLIVLSDQGYAETFGSHDRYFATTLPKQGELFPNYYAVTGGELANEIALISGQGPTPQTATNCPTFTKFVSTGTGRLGQLLGSGCTYPPEADTLANQLTVSGRGGWKAYIEGMNDAAGHSAQTCRHPSVDATDPNHSATAKDPYATWTNPFVYFDALTGKQCRTEDVPLTHLASDLRSIATTPALSYIAPDPCDDGSDTPCTQGAAAGLGPAQRFLETVIGEIERSPAYKADGMIAITFDQAPQTGPHADTTSCSACDSQTFPNLPTPTAAATATSTPTTTGGGTTTTATETTTTTTTAAAPTTTGTGPGTTPATTTPATTTTTTTTTTTPPATPGGASPGGGQVGLLVISRFMKPGSTDVLDYFNHFSLLASIEQLFGLKTIGYAHDPALPVFSATTYNVNAP